MYQAGGIEQFCAGHNPFPSCIEKISTILTNEGLRRNLWFNEETALTSVPSKTFNLMAVGSPLLCITTQQSEIAKIVDKYHNGFVCPATDVDKITSFIKKLADNKTLKQEMSNSSLVASKEFTYKNAEKYVQTLFQTRN